MSESTDVTDEGKLLIDTWLDCQTNLERARSAVNSADCALSNAKNALGTWLCPTDANLGETFCVWYGSSLIQATFVSCGTYEITVRKRGRGLR